MPKSSPPLPPDAPVTALPARFLRSGQGLLEANRGVDRVHLETLKIPPRYVGREVEVSFT